MTCRQATPAARRLCAESGIAVSAVLVGVDVARVYVSDVRRYVKEKE